MAVENVPDWHRAHVSEAEAPMVVEYEPGWQLLQSMRGSPEAVAYLPAGQLVQMDVDCPELREYVPDGHKLHVVADEEVA
jgi:hypothetical protein